MNQEVNLLIVDDEKIIIEGLSSIDWTSHGIGRVFLARNGEKALEVFLKENIQIVITDVKMPGLDGIELGNRINESSQKAKVIVLSGYGEFDYAKSAIKFGAIDYLLKPIEEAELVKAVKKAMLELREEKLKTLLRKKCERISELGIVLDEGDKALLQNFDGLLLHDKLFKEDNNMPKMGNSFSIQILMAVNYINMNYVLNLTADSLSKVVNRSKNYFSTQFKKEIGISMSDYINKVRIEHSKLLLKDTSYLTYEIAERVGYSEYRYFCTVFKKYTGFTPSQYR